MSGASYGKQDLRNELARTVNTVESGTAAAGSNATTHIVDPTRGWEVNVFTDYFLQYLPGAANAGLARRISANLADRFTTAAFSSAPTVGDEFIIVRDPGNAIQDVNVDEWGGTAQTGADLTPLFQNLDLALTDLRDALAGVAPATVGDLGLILDRLISILGQLDVALSTRASEVTVATLGTEVTLAQVRVDTAAILAQLDVVLSSRASEATAVTLVTEINFTAGINALLAALATEITAAATLARLDVGLSTRASEVTLATLATQATLASVLADTTGILAQIDVALSSRASEVTVATLATQATLASVLADTTLILAQLDVVLSGRASEATLVKQVPIAKANEFNVAAPGANTNILGAGITPTNSPSLLRVQVLLAVGSVFKARVTQGATTFDYDFNAGAALTAGSAYNFELIWETGDSVNFQVETDGIIQMLKAHEIGAGT